MAERPLVGCSVAVTRDEPGELGRLLREQGADVVHVPLITIVDPVDGGRALSTALADLDSYDWLIVTSPSGADRVVASLSDQPQLRLAAVGTATAARLTAGSGRPVDLVPDRQLAEELAAAFIATVQAPQRVLLALADRAAPALEQQLRDAGHDVTSVIAYRTELRSPSALDRDRIAQADAVVFTSGSAAEALAASLATSPDGVGEIRLPELAVAIGPTTATKARECGLKISSIAADHSLAGLVNELTMRWRELGTP